MSEFQPRFPEQERRMSPEKLEARNRELEAERERAAAKAEQSLDSIETIRDRLEQVLGNQEKSTEGRHEKTASEHRAPIGKHLQRHGRNQTLKTVRKQLPASQRVMSRLIHQAQVEAVSNAAESTVARPSGLLGAGILSVLTSLVVLYICRHYGYEYNFFIGLASLAAGFALGLIGEGLLRLAKPRKH